MTSENVKSFVEKVREPTKDKQRGCWTAGSAQLKPDANYLVAHPFCLLILSKTTFVEYCWCGPWKTPCAIMEGAATVSEQVTKLVLQFSHLYKDLLSLTSQILGFNDLQPKSFQEVLGEEVCLVAVWFFFFFSGKRWLKLRSFQIQAWILV